MGEMLKDSDDVFAEMIATKYPEEFKCALKIRDYIEKQYNRNKSSVRCWWIQKTLQIIKFDIRGLVHYALALFSCKK